MKVHDKEFEMYIPADKISERITYVAKKLNIDLQAENPLFLIVLNGSFMFAADLMKEIIIPCEISFIKLQSYLGTESTQNVNELIGMKEPVDNRTIVIVEDIVDTGNTIEYITQKLYENGAKSVKTASLLFKPSAYLKKIEIDYVALEIPNYFVIGYGLDYNGQGRNLNALYKLKE